MKWLRKHRLVKKTWNNEQSMELLRKHGIINKKEIIMKARNNRETFNNKKGIIKKHAISMIKKTRDDYESME